MSSIYFPVHVSALFRRVVNVLSTFSISHHYLAARTDNAPFLGDTKRSSGPSTSLNETLLESKGSFSKGSKQTPEREPSPEQGNENKRDIIHELLRNPALFDPLRKPRYPIVLCHGLYGFDTRGPTSFPSMRMRYWHNALAILRDTVGAEVIVTAVPSVGSISARSLELHSQLKKYVHGRGVNFMAHSMGGLDCRHLISTLKPSEYVPLSLTSICTPHRGSPFMDWCAENIGIGRLREEEEARSASGVKDDDMPYYPTNADAVSSQLSAEDSVSPPPSQSDQFPQPPLPGYLSSLPNSLASTILNAVDSPAYANLTTSYLRTVFNPSTPDDPKVKYFSVAGRMAKGSVGVWHPFWLPKLVLDGVEDKERSRLKVEWEMRRRNEEKVDSSGAADQGHEKESDLELWMKDDEWGNDGLVTVRSAKWGEFMGTLEGCDHWEMRGARGIEFGVDLPALPVLGLLPSLELKRRRAKQMAKESGKAKTESWSLGDWTKIVNVWRKEESDALSKEERQAESVATTSSSSNRLSEKEVKEDSARKEKERLEDEAILKQATEKLSLAFDWLIEHVPSPPSALAISKTKKDMKEHPDAVMNEVPGKTEGEEQAKRERWKKQNIHKAPGGKKGELETKKDLERFYVALSRKLYDEGL